MVDPQPLFFYISLGILGLLLGSFYNVVIYRYPKGVSIIRPRSYCPRCKISLQITDLIPFFSYLFLRGRCRHCREAISFRYTAVELGSGAIFIASFWRYGISLDLLKQILLLSVLLIISAIDLDIQKIPNIFVGIIFTWAFLWQLLSPSLPWLDAVLGLLAGAGITLLIALLSRGGMGGGDIKLLAVLGFLAGWLDLLLIFFMAVVLGAVVGMIIIIVKRKSGKTPLPFGPFMALSYFIVLFWGEQIWGFYLGTLLK